MKKMYMKKICMAGVSMLLVISGVFVYHKICDSKPKSLTLEETEAILREYREGNPKGLTPEQIQEVLKVYAESNPQRLTGEEVNGRGGECVGSDYGPGTNLRVVSYGSSGVGFINHETGEVIVYVTDPGDEK